MRMSFSVRCDYSRFKRLLRAFETDKRWLAVRSIGITRNPDQPGSVQVAIELATYFTDTDSHGGTASPVPPRAEKSAGTAAPTRRAG
jgi:hypothetical protein